MERVRQIGNDPNYPPVFFGTLTEVVTTRDAQIEATVDWIQTADKPIQISYSLVDGIEKAKAALKGVSHTPTGFVIFALEGIEHEPANDSLLKPNEITINDGSASHVVQLPRGRRLEIINQARSRFKLPHLDVQALKERFWRGNIAVLNGYRNIGRDKSTLVYFDQSEGS